MPEADLTPSQQEAKPVGFSQFVFVDNTCLSLPSNPAFHSLLASLFPRLANAYVITRVVRYRPGGLHPVYNLVLM